MNIEIDAQNRALVSKEDLQMLLDKGLIAPQIRVSHILVKDRQKAQEIAKELEKATDLKSEFTKLAAKYSECPSKANGGDLGYFTKGQMVPEFENAAFEMAVGTLAPEVQTQFGFHLLHKEDEKYLLALTPKS